MPIIDVKPDADRLPAVPHSALCHTCAEVHIAELLTLARRAGAQMTEADAVRFFDVVEIVARWWVARRVNVEGVTNNTLEDIIALSNRPLPDETASPAKCSDSPLRLVKGRRRA